jgi:hypothetical protein
MILEDMDDYPQMKSPKKKEDIDMNLIIKTFERKASRELNYFENDNSSEKKLER